MTLELLLAALETTCVEMGKTFKTPRDALHAKQAAMGFLLQDLRNVSVTQYHKPEWTLAVQSSGLAEVLMTITDPKYLLDNSDDADLQGLARLQRLQDALALILYQWVPPDVSDDFVPDQRIFQATAFSSERFKQDSVLQPGKGSLLLKVLEKHSDLLPRTANPECVFFLVSLPNFMRAWDRWLGYALERKGYCVANIATSEKTLADTYSSLSQAISDRWKQGHFKKLCADPNSALGAIITRTMEMKVGKREYYDWLHANDIRNVVREHTRHHQIISCSRCAHLPAAEQCVRMEVVLRRDASQLLGHGLSQVPESGSAQPENKKAGRIFNPKDFDMRPVRKNPQTVERCAREIVIFVDADGPPVPPSEITPAEKSQGKSYITARDPVTGTLKQYYPLDFVMFNAFSPKVWASMCERDQNLSHMAPIQRGARFKNHSAGKMAAAGARQPKGGGPGDTYGYYACLEAETICGIHVLFDIAMDSMYLREGARYACPSLVASMDRDVAEADRLGLTGQNLFACDGYCAPIHFDEDEGRGLCCQIRWVADRQYDEYGFCQPAWGYWIATEPNMLWSFDSSDPHGTMLPSKLPLTVAVHNAHPASLSGASSTSNEMRGPVLGDDDHDDHGDHDHDNNHAGRLLGLMNRIRARHRAQNNAPVAVPVPTRTSTGKHETNPAKNVRRARQYDRAVRTRRQTNDFWRRT
ncbi:hypothetical protein BDZ89DRAFT_1131924 [Hymenopellis radicata]|nr:hypothetical protein BDZ89DRAFT_1131924 [Hymenopellis radicata]